MPKLVISKRARRDLIDISHCIGKDSPVNASRFIQKLKQNFQLLYSRPLLGRARHEFAADMRSISYGSYMIFYRVSQENIEIAHVVHGARDIERLIKNRERF